MGEIAVNQNSTIILPVPIDLLRPYLAQGPDGSRGDYEARAQRERLAEEEEAVGDVYAALEVLGCSPYGLTTGYAHTYISIRCR